jgi:hypothetical protein
MTIKNQMGTEGKINTTKRFPTRVEFQLTLFRFHGGCDNRYEAAEIRLSYFD